MRLRVALASIALTAGVAVPVVGAPGPACATEAQRAVLVVDTGSQVLRYCVSLDDESVSGTELIVLASRQYGLSYRFGFGGGAVCMLAGVGTTGDDCFEEYPDFWGYWRGDGGTGWSWSSTGAASTTVSNGDVEGWAWGSGNDGSTHPAPPPTGFGAVCKSPRKPRTDDGDQGKEKKRTSEGGQQPASPSASEAPVPQEEEDSDPRRVVPDKTRRRSRTNSALVPPHKVADASDVVTFSRPDPSASPRPIASTPGSGSGPPAAGVAGLVVAALLAGAGFGLRRRTKSLAADGD